jgi:hypothetical protein
LGTIANFFYQFGTFLFVPSYSGTKQNFFIFKKWYQNETKTFQIAPGLLKDRTKLSVVFKKIWKQNRTKALGQKNSSTK